MCLTLIPGVYKFHYSPPPWGGGGTKFNPKNLGKEIQGKKGGKKEGKKRKRKENEEERKRKRKEKEKRKKKEGRKKKYGKKKVEIGEETLLKFAGVPLSKFLKINRYLKPEVRVFLRGEGGSFVDGKNW